LVTLVLSPQALSWKQAAAGTSKPEGLTAFKQLLAGSCQNPSDAASQLDIAFDQDRLGKALLSYASQSSDFDTAAATAQMVTPFARGFKAVSDGEWLAAHDAFTAAAKHDVRAKAMLALCEFKLGGETAVVMRHLNEDTSPVQHLVRGLVFDKELGNLDLILRRRKLAQVSDMANKNLVLLGGACIDVRQPV
jgi:hypothetical protein